MCNLIIWFDYGNDSLRNDDALTNYATPTKCSNNNFSWFSLVYSQRSNPFQKKITLKSEFNFWDSFRMELSNLILLNVEIIVRRLWIVVEQKNVHTNKKKSFK